MIAFIRENWRRLRAPNENGRVLMWPWAALGVAVLGVFYGAVAALCATFGWLCRRVQWLRRFGGPSDDGPGNGLFYSKPADRPSGGSYGYVGPDGMELPTAHQTVQAQATQQQLLAAHLRAERERAWADEMAMHGEFGDEPFDNESMYDDEAMYDPLHHRARHVGGGRGEGYGDYSRNQHRQHHPHRPHQHRQDGRHQRRARRGRNGRQGQRWPRLRLSGRRGLTLELC